MASLPLVRVDEPTLISGDYDRMRFRQPTSVAYIDNDTLLVTDTNDRLYVLRDGRGQVLPLFPPQPAQGRDFVLQPPSAGTRTDDNRQAQLPARRGKPQKPALHCPEQ